MKTRIIIPLLLAVVLIVACSKVPITGRKQLKLLPESQMMSMSLTSYNDVLSKSKVVKTGNDVAMVKRVGDKLAKSVALYLQQNKMSDQIAGFNWEFNLIEDATVNAWCMPGGKVAFYTGILPICKDETGIAVVMGHEIAHAIARHGNERMSQQLAQQFGGQALSVALASKPQQTQQIFATAYGLGAQFAVMLPFSRMHESEADQMGLYFMAMAGYDPKQAPAFWQRMNGTGGARPPEFMSTHPSPQTRIADINKWMPKALEYYKTVLK
jgi:predicted Zn-dependent protease